MRWSLLFTSALFFLHCGAALAAPTVELGERGVDAVATLNKRADQDTKTTATNNDATQPTAATTTGIETIGSHEVGSNATTATTTTDPGTTTSPASQTYAATTVPSLDGPSSSSSQASQNETHSAYSGGLPIKPEITPALGVGGFILLVLGGALALIGIRKQSVFIFLSTAFLAALGITVLIIYVMNPPVSNGAQGGYLVAVVVTGAIFGGLALVFKEITEGLCCLLGGFCVGMWLMTLKSGGLVTGDGPKAGFIIGFSAGFYCLSFSHYTRAYGSMFCTAFGGATALVLGIDCFSRAGLKEFWLYIWGLNDNMFPYHTYTYPVTRNIRVESAVIIIITVFGVIGQMRLWKVIKARRAKEESSRQEAEKKKDEDDAEVGRQLEANNLRERAEWEEMYGNGHDGEEPSLSETAIADDSRRGSDGFESSTPQEKDNAMEMKPIATIDQSAGASDSGNPLETVEEVDHDTDAEDQDACSQCEVEIGDLEAQRPVSAISQRTSEEKLHFPEDNDSEHGAVVDSEVGTQRGSKRFSSKSWINRLPGRFGNVQFPDPQSVSQEALIVHDDTASSVAGVVDELTIISGPRSIASGIDEDGKDQAHEKEISNEGAPEQNVLSEATVGKLNSQTRQPAAPPAVTTGGDLAISHEPEDGNHHTTENDQENHGNNTVPTDSPGENLGVKSENAVVQVQQDEPASQRENQKQEPSATVVEKVESNAEEAVLEKQPSASPKTEPKEINDSNDPRSNIENNVTEADSVSQTNPTNPMKKPTLDMTTVKKIPEQTSKVIHSFRTKEWAKHLADAETPDLEPLELENDVQEDSDKIEEAAAPVHVDGLLQTALNAQPPPAVMSPELSVSSSEQIRRLSDYSSIPSPEMSRSKTRNSLHNLSDKSPPPLMRNASMASIIPRQEQDAITPMLRSTSTPFLTVTSPGKGKAEPESPRWNGPPPLLAVRENMVRNRMSSTSLRHDPWASRNASHQSLPDAIQATSPTVAIPEERDEDFEAAALNDNDDVPLSQRRVILQRQSMQFPSGMSAMNSPSPIYPQSYERSRSPQSTQVNPERSASRMAAWRQSVREDISQRRDPLAFRGSSPGPASPERPRSLWGSVQQMRDASSSQVDLAVAEGMQRGSMTDLHRQAMRRMQASANRQL
ncbi:uncharacterized protein N7498_010462 [Penicillium cinerascens]|uniref:TM7S3/TM198-like domain-containing protein n=1 Tax=Penicillium cinerascens TaxID=70096 RepID=A0A9W9J7S0_9EURO|nr:uncharacterized protein N7498_010462 [Penicillium cinerascens]KAJ5191477.1 hypothetical protein N7498_010462 [Penicillium cinerascens]